MSRRLGIFGKLPTYARPEDHKRSPLDFKNNHLIILNLSLPQNKIAFILNRSKHPGNQHK